MALDVCFDYGVSRHGFHFSDNVDAGLKRLPVVEPFFRA
ncbi:hypothetical protein NK6_2832 [Bradyrhizobium diazoefficiens]|uniref:Uncharacterized protein n=1 Tax=Bradyrhizobium diazoefficiens TaxID=1355477 RepID=A0A0E4BNJ9_9BRAD|nr:hypothetical protein NK6_2832 [Bradyrhizobium diazoefficiens]